MKNSKVLFSTLLLVCCLYSCISFNKKEKGIEGHCILMDLREGNKTSENFIISTEKDTSYFHLYDYPESDYINDFDKGVIHVIPKEEEKSYILGIGLYVDIKYGTTINKVNNSTFLSIRDKILKGKNVLDSNSDESYFYGIGLYDTQDSLFYILNNKTETILLLKEIDKILQESGYNDVSEQLNAEIIDNI